MVAMANRQSGLPTIKRPSCEDPSTVLYLYERVEKSVEIIEGLKAQNRSLLETNQQLQVKIGKLEAEVDRLRGTLAIHVKHRFGPRSERVEEACEKSPAQESVPSKGAQPGHKGHGRKVPEALPIITNVHECEEGALLCPKCGQPRMEVPIFESSWEVHVEFRYVLQENKRKVYKRTCSCATPPLITAPAPPKLIPKGKFSSDFWAQVLYDRFALQTPWNRQIRAMSDFELDVSRGTLTGGLKSIFPYFVPFYELLEDNIRSAKRRHSDETSWIMVQEERMRWWLWAQRSPEVVFFCFDPSRSHRVPARLLGQSDEPFLIVADRYAAYKSLTHVIIAFCWAHMRRDFLRVGKSYPHNAQVQAWVEKWKGMIADLYRINRERLSSVDPKYLDHHRDRLLETLYRMWEASLEPMSFAAQIKVVESLHRHWEGLTLFVDDPLIPMDNNLMERHLRNPVMGRNNSPVLRSSWAALLNAMLYSITETCRLHQVNVHQWLRVYLQACALHQDAPPDLEDYLPWKIKESGFPQGPAP